ncbi:MAG: lipase [Spirochaetes bacterium]|nr:lipase [Spirochaetota bacterium]
MLCMSIRTLLSALLCLSGVASLSAGAGSSTNTLKGTYPIVLSHGMFGWGQGPQTTPGAISLNYFSAVDYLRQQGAAVYVPTKSALSSNASRGQELKNLINQWMAANNYTKVNIMGHSQGGLDARYMISNLGMASKVAVLTTIATPHRGAPLANIVLNVIPSWLQPYVATVFNTMTSLALYGGAKQDLISSLSSLTTSGLASFNATTPDAAGVKYYSYGGKVTIPDLIQHPLVGTVCPVTGIGGVYYGQGLDSDCVVPLSSAKWGTWMGTPSTPITSTGVDHVQSANNIMGSWFDLNGFYQSMALNAKNHQ